MKALVNGTVENIHHLGEHMVIVVDDNIEGGLRVIYTTDVKRSIKVNYDPTRYKVIKRKVKRRRMTALDKLFINN